MLIAPLDVLAAKAPIHDFTLTFRIIYLVRTQNFPKN